MQVLLSSSLTKYSCMPAKVFCGTTDGLVVLDTDGCGQEVRFAL